MSFLQVSGIYKQQAGISTINNISFSQNQFQKIAIAGETGSGKSTLLKMIGGLVQPDAGEVLFEGKRVKGPLETLLPGHAGIAYLSQHFELRNNYRIEEELDYFNQLSKEEANDLFEVCRISHLLRRKTNEVSGGEKQRISLARLLLSSPKLLLLDEPYSNLDIIHKNILKKVVQQVGEKLGISCILISHDPNDLLSWADEIIILKNGKIAQQGAPNDMYNQPVDEYVAALFGSYNLLSKKLYNFFQQTPVEENDSKKILSRPEQFIINSLQAKFIKGSVKAVRFLGNANEVDVLFDNEEMITVRTGLSNISEGDTVRVSLPGNQIHFID